MPATDAELDLLRQNVNCAFVLERMARGWKLDTGESTKRALKYRHSGGGIIIVNHDGHGWWDPTSSAKGDVFNLVQHLDPSLNFGRVRQVLRRFVGITPAYPRATREKDKPDRSPAERWATRPPLRRGDAAWTYLSRTRAIPDMILRQAARQDGIRLGAYGSAWFAYRWNSEVSHVEIRSPTFKGSLRGGRKTLFQFGEPGAAFRRLAVLEAPIDALSLAAVEQQRADTLYVATGGGMGPGTLQVLRALLSRLAQVRGVLASGADANGPGDRYADRHAAMAKEADVRAERLRPPQGQDWNDILVGGRSTYAYIRKDEYADI